MKPAALPSVHDVAPSTLPEVLEILRLLDASGVPPPTLLVIPGREWTPETLMIIRDLAESGHRLAGHGWHHECDDRRSLYHRVHGLIISRDQAEHLSRPREELLELVAQCHAWFTQVDLPSPNFYVPPAWAMGRLTPSDLEALPFRLYETLSGLMDAETGRRVLLPLVGFEADTLFRRWSLRIWNRIQMSYARASGRPVRIAIHPHDLSLLMGEDLELLVEDPWRFVTEEEAVGGIADGP